LQAARHSSLPWGEPDADDRLHLCAKIEPHRKEPSGQPGPVVFVRTGILQNLFPMDLASLARVSCPLGRGM